MKKRMLSVLLVLSLAVSYVSFASTEELLGTEAEFLVSIGMIPSGYSEDAPVSRGEFAKMLTDLLYEDIDISEVFTTEFTDVFYGTTYYNSISILESQKIVRGSGNKAFNPDLQIRL